MGQELAAAKLKRSIKPKIQSATEYVYYAGDSVLVWRERIVNSKIDEFIRPFTVLTYDPVTKIVINDQNRSKKRYTVA